MTDILPLLKMLFLLPVAMPIMKHVQYVSQIRRRPRKSRRRLTRTQRLARIQKFIVRRPRSLKQISQHEKLRLRRTRSLMRRLKRHIEAQSLGQSTLQSQRRKVARITRGKRRTLWVRYYQQVPTKKPVPEPLRPIGPRGQSPNLALVLRLRYRNVHRAGRDIEITCVTLLWHDESVSRELDPNVRAARDEMRQATQERLSSKLAGMADLMYISDKTQLKRLAEAWPAEARGQPYFRQFRRQGGLWSYY
jgi:hypothetical protein